jgi:glycosyltransferase involved in cell wall biosynthesis
VKTVHVVLPNDIDDPDRPSGGNTYDRRICDGLTQVGWDVREVAVPGNWPWPDTEAEAALAAAMRRIPDGTAVLVDGLIASTSPAVLVPHARRLPLVVLVHLPLGDGPPGHHIADAKAREGAVLSAARAVVTTSRWTREQLLDLYSLPNVFVAEPGVGKAELAIGTSSGGHLLSVGAVTPHKGHDVLLSALARVVDLPWECVCVGPLDRDVDFVDRLRRQAFDDGIGDRVRFTGSRTGAGLDLAYAEADVLVSASLAETYGMVITEALARGVPVIASAVGAVPSALGREPDGRRPGLLVPPGDEVALSEALRSWLSDSQLRSSARQAARARRLTLSGWPDTTERIAHVLVGATP